MDASPAGYRTRRKARRLKARAIGTMLLMLAAVPCAGVATGWYWPAVVGVAIGAIAGISALERASLPAVGRWSRGARGEEHVGRVLEELESEGWLTIHGFHSGRGSDIDTIVVGPGGVLTIEVKSHPGRVSADRLDPGWLKQAYSHGKRLERITGRQVTPLLVLSRAYLEGRPIARRRGVLVLPARMLAAHLRKRPATLTPAEAHRLRATIAAALG